MSEEGDVAAAGDVTVDEDSIQLAFPSDLPKLILPAREEGDRCTVGV
jgi:hypothetical protein